MFLYLNVLVIEYSPVALEWLRLRKIRNAIVKLTLVLTIFGVVLSTMHQSSLGALFLIAPSKLHPLWYSSYIPVFFFVSSMFAGLSMVIFEGTLCASFLSRQDGRNPSEGKSHVALGFAKAASWIMTGYLAMKVFGLAMDNNWHYLATGYGLWFLVELLGFVALPAFVYMIAVREKRITLVRWTAAWTVLGIVLNRFNVPMVAFNWQLPSADRYFPHWMEIGVTVFLVTGFLIVFRFMVTRMPVLHEHPEYKDSHLIVS